MLNTNICRSINKGRNMDMKMIMDTNKWESKVSEKIKKEIIKSLKKEATTDYISKRRNQM